MSIFPVLQNGLRDHTLNERYTGSRHYIVHSGQRINYNPGNEVCMNLRLEYALMVLGTLACCCSCSCMMEHINGLPCDSIYNSKPRQEWPVYNTMEKWLIDPLHYDSSVWIETKK
jgi:hypothetical protein